MRAFEPSLLNSLNLFQVEMVLIGQSPTQKHLKAVRARFSEDHLIDIRLDVNSLVFALQSEIQLRTLVKNHRVGGIHDFDALNMKSQAITPGAQNREFWVCDGELLSEKVGKKPIKIEFPVWSGND